MIYRLILTLLGCCLMMISTTAGVGAATKLPTVTALKNSIYLAQDWLVRFQKEDGLYHYIYRPWALNQTTEPKESKISAMIVKESQFAPGTAVPEVTLDAYPDEDNIVRQILSYWALIKSTDFRSTPEIEASIKKFEARLERDLIKILDTPFGKGLFIHFNDAHKVNSTALYLAALLSKHERNMPLTDVQKQHIEYAVTGLKAFASTEEGGFNYYYDTDQFNFISPYGSGEAQLALAQYINMTKDKDLYAFAQDHFEKYFDKHFSPAFANPASFIDKERVGYITWGLYYLREIDKFKPVDYARHVRPLIQFMLDYRAINDECTGKGCVYSMAMWDSSSVEGMSAAFELMLKYETDQDLITEVKDYLDMAMMHLLSLQVHSVEQYEDITGHKFRGNPDHLVGGFCDWPECGYMRNEVTMHVTTSMMEYYHLFYR